MLQRLSVGTDLCLFKGRTGCGHGCNGHCLPESRQLPAIRQMVKIILFTQRFGADPGVMEYNGRVYVYTTNDVIEYDSDGKVTENTYAQVNKINCLSSEDLVNWTDHGAIPVAGTDGIAKWATCSWAPCAAHKNHQRQRKIFPLFLQWRKWGGGSDRRQPNWSLDRPTRKSPDYPCNTKLQ